MSTASTDLTRVAELLGIGRSAAYNAAKAGEFPFPCFRIGGRWVVPAAPLAEMLGITVADVLGSTTGEAA